MPDDALEILKLRAELVELGSAVRQLRQAGLGDYRLELLEEDATETRRIIRTYQALLAGESAGEELWRSLKAQSQLGVTRGTL